LRPRRTDREGRVSAGNTDGSLRAVEESRLDLALVTLPASGRSLHTTRLLEDEFGAIFASSQRPMPARMTPERLSEQPLGVFEAGSSTRLLIDEWFLQAGIRVTPVMALGSIEAIKALGAAGLGDSSAPRPAVAALHHRRRSPTRPLSTTPHRAVGSC
ncbi:LysR family transcriptional regulator, partial [Pseudomonas syringae]